MHCPQCHQPLTQVGTFWVCPAHGMVRSPVKVPVCAEANGKPVFVSYGRADGLEFSRRLAGDLTEHGRHDVWLDLENIEKGGLFEVRIEQGIRSAAVVVAVMTPASVREQSVCRDEVVFALNEGKTVVPLRAHPEVKPTLLLARRNWIDFTAGYEQDLADLLSYLAGDASALRPIRLPTVTGVAPLDFGPEIARYSAGFMGREWLAEEVEHWLAGGKQRVLVLVGEPGMGKSAIAAWLSLTRPEAVGVHFCTHRNTRSLDPYEFVASLVGQLNARLPGFAEAVEARHPDVRRRTAGDACRELIVEPARQLPAPPQPHLVIVDSLDEAVAQPGETVVDLLVAQSADLPAWLCIATTTRPEAPILERVRTLRVFELQADRPENRADVRAYIDARLRTPLLADLVGPTAALGDRLDELGAGNFLCARLAMDALEDGSLAVADLGSLAPGLAHFYGLAFERRFRDGETYARSWAPLLRVLAAAQGPLPFALLQRVVEEEPESVHRRLRELRTYLRVSGSGDTAAYALFHKSLQDWLTDREATGEYWCEARKGHRRLAEVLLPRFRGDGYALRHLVTHLLAADQSDEAVTLLRTPGFLEAKTEAGLVFDLTADFTTCVANLAAAHPWRRRLGLLEEALRADIHFIARHPSCLFQCLWNRAWWYDCPEAARHYEQHPKGSLAGPPPWEEAGPRLATLLEDWRRGKEKEMPGFRWLRSLRPPAIHLGTAQKAVFSGHLGPVYSVAFSPDGRRVGSGSWDWTVRVWDAASGAELLCLRGHVGSVTSVSFSSDGQRLVSGSEDRRVRVWDAASGAELRCPRGHRDPVTSVSFSPDGQLLVSGSEDRTVRVWDTASGGKLRSLTGHKNGVTSVSFSPDGQRLVTGSLDHTVRVWDAANGAELLCLRGHEDGVNGVSFSPNGQRLVSGSEDKTVRVWDAASGSELLCLRGHENGVNNVSFSPNGQRLVSGSLDKTMRVWDAASFAELRRLRGHEREATCVSFSPDGQRLVTGSLDHTVRVWDAANGDELLCLRGHENRVSSLSFSSNGQRLVSGSDDSTVRVWDAASGGELLCLTGHKNGVTSVSFSPNGQRLASGSWEDTVRVWDAASGAELHCLCGHKAKVNSVSFSPDGQRLVSGSHDSTVRVWDAASGAELLCLHGHEHRVISVSFSSDGHRLVSGSCDQTVRVWDAASGAELLCLRGHEGVVSKVSFSPDGQRLVSGSWATTARGGSSDNTVRVWNVANGICLQEIKGTGDIVPIPQTAARLAWERRGRKPVEVIRGRGDVVAIAIGAPPFPWRAISRGLETVIESSATGEPLAWFPMSVGHIVTHPSGRNWAGSVGNYMCLFSLEGG
jgi:WD40 repeat protein